MRSLRKYPTPKILFDRRKKSSKTKTGTIEIEILYQGKRKWISTGVHVLPSEWDYKHGITGRIDSLYLNKKIQKLHLRINNYIHGLLENDKDFSWVAFEKFLAIKNDQRSFLEFIETTCETKTNITKGTYKNHKKLLNCLRSYGEIVYFSDLTLLNIIEWDKWLHKKNYKQTTVASYHKFMKVYIHDAMRANLLEKDPYNNFKVDRGKPGLRLFLTEKELEAIKIANLPSETYTRVRDLFLFQCYTGLAYADLCKFDFSKVIEKEGKFVIHDVRQKTGEDFYLVLLSNAIEILKKYNFNLPVISNQQYNMRLKIVAGAAKLERNLTSHMGRHTYASIVLNSGISIEILKEMMGHTDIKTTQLYAKMVNKTVENAFELLESKLNT